VSTPLSDEEFWQLLRLTQRYAETGMDQWDKAQRRRPRRLTSALSWA
jgi:hypothetical protein